MTSVYPPSPYSLASLIIIKNVRTKKSESVENQYVLTRIAESVRVNESSNTKNRKTKTGIFFICTYYQ